VISESRIPVLVVRRPRTQFRKALICTGGMESAEKRIHAGVRLIQAAGAHADLLHVTGMVPSMYTGLNEMDEDLKKLLDSDTPVASNLRRGAEMLNEFELSGELHLRSGTVVETILREAEEGDYDLIVLGQTKANESVQGFLLGNVTRQVIEGAPCPVLVVR
jgi:nucleotide-binding universal stress UspA family protein